MNLTPGMYFLHILHEQFSGTHFLISPLKEDKNDFCFIIGHHIPKFWT